jgi:hypothetical protein
MINKDEFHNLIGLYQDIDKQIEIWKTAGVDIIECPLVQDFWKIFDLLLYSNYDQEQVDTIYWWLLEKSNDPDIKMYVDKKEYPIDTVDQLFNFINDVPSNSNG